MVEDVLVELAKKESISEYQLCVFKPYVKKKEEYFPIMLKIPDSVFWVYRKNVVDGFLENLEEKHIDSEEKALGLTSLVRLMNNKEGHLPLIDFDCEKSSENLVSVCGELDLLGCSNGYVLDSGRSYHYIGADVLSSGEFRRFLKNMQESDVIGENWPRLQEELGYAVLRLTACPKRGKPQLPRLVERIEKLQLRIPGI